MATFGCTTAPIALGPKGTVNERFVPLGQIQEILVLLSIVSKGFDRSVLNARIDL